MTEVDASKLQFLDFTPVECMFFCFCLFHTLSVTYCIFINTVSVTAQTMTELNLLIWNDSVCSSNSSSDCMSSPGAAALNIKTQMNSTFIIRSNINVRSNALLEDGGPFF